MESGIIQNQYKNTNIETFLTALNAVIDKHTSGLVDYIRENVFNLDTATGVGLDLWGNILGFPRYLPTPADTGEINTYPFNFKDKNFYKLQYKSQKQDFTYIALDDNSYRTILKTITLKLTSDCTLTNLNDYCNFLFSKFGGEAFVRDSEDMRFATYIFRFEIPEWLKYVLDNYDILPRPAGVYFRYIESIAYYIGFKGQSSFNETGKTDFTNFYKSIFKKIDLQEYLENAIKNFSPKQERVIAGHKDFYFNSDILNFVPEQTKIYIDEYSTFYNSNILETQGEEKCYINSQVSYLQDITEQKKNLILYKER